MTAKKTPNVKFNGEEDKVFSLNYETKFRCASLGGGGGGA